MRAGGGCQIVEYWGGSWEIPPNSLNWSGVACWALPGFSRLHPGTVPEMGLFELPFLFDTALEAATVGWLLTTGAPSRGSTGAADGFQTAPTAFFMRRSIDTPLAMEGCPGHRRDPPDWLNSLGAAAQTMSAIDMNQALDRDIVDGGIQGWSGMRTFGSFRWSSRPGIPPWAPPLSAPH
ncbi:MAG: hypothetical protein CM15mP103_08070 [Gammaproteobacteria bacterium]|nr:MAG: hypothetical protein CM15mP103_08070 [Gammaproteobacteria bacterium]